MAEYNMAVVRNKSNEEIIVDEIIDYVKNRNYEEEASEDSFVFGSIAISINGEDKVDIGSKLILGDDYNCDESLKSQLEEINRRFGQALNNKSCYSITKYLKINKLKCFSLQLDDEPSLLSLYLFDQIRPKTIKSENGLFDFSNSIYAPKYVDDYSAPMINGKLRDALDAFNITIGYYNSFHHLVRDGADKGYIYLIRPSNSDAIFTALAYVYLKLPLDGKDIEIISQKLANIYLGILKNKARQETIKSVKSAIMSRNMSHNLGSHVMFYVKQKLESVSSIFKEGTLEQLIQAKSVTELKKQLGQQKYNDEMPFLVGLGRFINYLQERQDYIATVATNHIPYRSTISFKDSIYDELKPEKRFERHYLDKDAKDRRADNLLLDFIAYSEGFTSSDKIELKFRKDETHNQGYDDIDFFDGTGEPKDVPAGLREFNVALPGGNLGRQAFFSIMENIIRNTAKHEYRHAVDEKLTFFFDKLNPSDIRNIHGFSWRRGEDKNHNNATNINYVGNDSDVKNCYERCKNDYYYLGITVKLRCSEGEIINTLNKITEGLRQDYLTPDELMDENCKGLKEIRISSAWIRGKEMDDEISSEEPPAVAIRKTDEGYLQYVVCFPKPKKVAIIVNSELETNTYNVFSINDVENRGTYNRIADYDLVIVDENVSNEQYKKIQSNVGARIIKRRLSQGKNITDLLSEEFAYKEWIHDAFNIKNEEFPKISILDNKVHDVQCSISVSPFVKPSGTSENNSSYYKNCIVFNTHYPGQPKKEEEDRLLYSTANFVEAISGGNTTDRLVRREKRDMEWYAKHVAAGKTKVAIFDERIYEFIMPPINFVKISDDEKRIIRNKVVGFSKENPEASATVKIDFVQKITNDRESALSILRDTNNIEDGFADVDALSNKIVEYKCNETVTDYSRAWKYRESGVWAYNIRMVDSNKIQIIGYNAPIEDPIGLYSTKYYAGTVATIIKDEKDAVRIESDDNIVLKRFDFITIHQGILDKIYNAFNIKDFNKKKKVTERLFDYFSIKEKVDINEEETFLPQFIIHSGRSKPNSKDMPQHQPFLQFSALDYAIRDCKYTLTELLYSAHYEDSSYSY